jgi:fatty acid desaturase
MTGAILLPLGPALACAVLAVLALYRATLFIHEITHLNHAHLPGFRTGWNLLLGVPTMLPSFMYEGIHIIHHTRTRYGTVEDPEYLPLALMKPWSLPVFLLVSALLPVGLLLRFGILAPLSMLSPGLRRVVVERFSGLQTNPKFKRRGPEGDFARRWFWQELGASLMAIALLTAVATHVLPLRAFLICLAIVSGAAVLNQLRTLVAHLWENDGEQMTVTAQYLDSTNVPEGLLPALWAPVGLRYHALHHLLPSLPYHALGEAIAGSAPLCLPMAPTRPAATPRCAACCSAWRPAPCAPTVNHSDPTWQQAPSGSGLQPPRSYCSTTARFFRHAEPAR